MAAKKTTLAACPTCKTSAARIKGLEIQVDLYRATVRRMMQRRTRTKQGVVMRGEHVNHTWLDRTNTKGVVGVFKCQGCESLGTLAELHTMECREKGES
jgi:hypothetical protein